MKLIPLTQNKFARVDDKDYPRLNKHKWFLSASYPCTMIGRQPVRMHQLILKAPMVDHMNGDVLDNQRENLRPCNKSQNGANSKKRGGKLSSVYKGVYWSADKGKWAAQITKNYKTYMLGRFEREIDAALCYDLWALMIHGQYARTNFKVVATNCIKPANERGDA